MFIRPNSLFCWFDLWVAIDETSNAVNPRFTCDAARHTVNVFEITSRRAVPPRSCRQLGSPMSCFAPGGESPPRPVGTVRARVAICQNEKWQNICTILWAPGVNAWQHSRITSFHSLFFSICASPAHGVAGANASCRRRCINDKVPVYRRATQEDKRLFALSPTANLEFPVCFMFLGCRRKLD